MGGVLKIIVLAIGLGALRAVAASITNVPSADTSLIEIAPTNNNGAQAWFLAGKIQNDRYKNRALIKFDFTNLPSNALIESVALNVEVTRVPDEPPVNSTFGLRRMLRPWGEGDKAANPFAIPPEPPGQGRPATAGEATWLCAFFPTNEWSAPGGAEGVDFSAVESSFEFIGGLGPYRFPSTPELVADVQDWIHDPQVNHGWMLLSNDEVTILTARRFASREDPDAHPTLEIEYTAVPVIESARHANDQFQLTFTAWPGQTCVVEYRDSLTQGSWQTLTNLESTTVPTRYSITDPPMNPQRFYRVVSF
ncbi:MAG: hypothetical protein KJ070_09820 [Verrucomicrobia bacterium]|nr:hypothetical protein [Verrucomicrobiota bacterium]